MDPTDQELAALVRDAGHSMNELFIVDGRVHVSSDAGDFRPGSTYAPFELIGDNVETSLISFLRRSAAPEYASVAQLNDEIAQLVEWEALYDELTKVLDNHRTHDASGQGDSFLVEDLLLLRPAQGRMRRAARLHG